MLFSCTNVELDDLLCWCEYAVSLQSKDVFLDHMRRSLGHKSLVFAENPISGPCKQCPWWFLGKISQDPSVSKSNQFQVVIFQVFRFKNLKYISQIPLKWWVIFLESWTSPSYRLWFFLVFVYVFEVHFKDSSKMMNDFAWSLEHQHFVISQFLFMYLRYISLIPLKWRVMWLKSWTSACCNLSDFLCEFEVHFSDSS